MGCSRSNKGVVGIVVTVLLIGLIMAVGTIINMTYVPQWLKEHESSHMQEVQRQFIQLKYAADLLAILGQHTAISVPISLGADEIPIIGKGKTYDSLEINEKACTVTIRNETQEWIYKLGNIQFRSGNTYFVNQDYIYECGALILNQSLNSTLLGKPLLTADFEGLYFTLINVTTSGAPSISGYGIYPVWLEFVTSEGMITIDDVIYINITSNYPNAWNIFFRGLFGESDNPYTLDSISREGNKIVIDLTDNPSKLNLKYVEISADLSLGG